MSKPPFISSTIFSLSQQGAPSFCQRMNWAQIVFLALAAGALVFFLVRTRSPPSSTPSSPFGTNGASGANETNKATTPTTGASVTQIQSLHIPDVGQNKGKPDINLPSFIPPNADQLHTRTVNTTDHNIAPEIQLQWAQWEKQHQVNSGQLNPDGLPQTGAFFPHTWTPIGPIDPLVPRLNENDVTPGPQDPQLAFGLSIANALDAQEKKFSASENLHDITYGYRNELQQIPGSHFVVNAASFDGYETPQVVDRFALLPQQAAQWVVAHLNEQMRKEHPCFLLAGREHFEISNAPMSCGGGDGGCGVKQNPVTLIRIFESRVQKLRDGRQLVYLTLELGNSISGGAGGMFETIVVMDKFQHFVSYTSIARDEKHTFILPRSR